MVIAYGPVALFAIAGIVFCAITLAFAMILRPADQYDEKRLVYECGIPPTGIAWSRFFVRYYVIAILFVIFEVETIFLFPWAAVYRKVATVTDLGALPAAEMGVFVAILLVGLAYAWRKGDLRWT